MRVLIRLVVLVFLCGGLFLPAGVPHQSTPVFVPAAGSRTAADSSPPASPSVQEETGVLSWTGAGGDERWSNPRNWEGGRIPGPADTARFAGNAADARLDLPAVLGGLRLEGDYAGTVRLERPLQVHGDLILGGGTLECGSASLHVQGAVQVSAGLLRTPSGATMDVVTLHIDHPGVVQLGPAGKLNLRGDGEPLTGSGLLDTTTNVPNSIEYTGNATADITAAGPAAGLRLAGTEGFRRIGSLDLLRGAEYPVASAVIDPLAGYAYFGSYSFPSHVVKVELATFTRVGALTLIDDEGGLETAVIDPAAGFAYFGSGRVLHPGRIIKVDLATFARVDALPLSDGERYVATAVIDPAAGFAYFGVFGNPSHIVKVDLSTFTRTDTLVLDTNDNAPECAVIDTAAGFAYFGTSGSPGHVVKVDLATFTRAGMLHLNAGEDSPMAAVIDLAAGYAYFGTFSGPGRIVKVDLATFSRIDALTLDAGEDLLHSAVLDGAGYAYFGTNTTPGRVVRVDLVAFAHAGTLTLGDQENGLGAAVVDPPAGYAYFGATMYPGRIVRVALATFSHAGTLTLEYGEDLLLSAVIDPLTGYAYFGTGNSPGRIVKIDLATFTRVGALTLNADENEVVSAVIDPAAGYAYFGAGGYADPGRIVKIDLDTFTRVGAIALGDDEDDVQAAVIDPAAGYAYFGAGAYPPHVIRVNLASFARAGTLVLGPGEWKPASAVVDPAAHFAYFGTENLPGRVVKVDLTTFTRAGALILNSGEDILSSAVIDPAAGYAYFGTRTDPGWVVKVDLTTFTRVGALALEPGEDRVTAAVIDPAGGYAYFYAYHVGSGRVVQVRLADFARAGSVDLDENEYHIWCAAADLDAGYAYLGQWSIPGRVIKLDIADARDVRMTKAVAPAAAAPGETITYTLAFSNASRYVVSGVRITDILPLELGGIRVISSGAAITPAVGTRYAWEVQDLPYHGGGAITVSGALSSCLPAGRVVTNSAVITASWETDPVNNRSTVVLTVLNAAPLAADDAYAVRNDIPLVVPAPGVLLNDVDANCDVLRAILGVPPATGTLTLNDDGSLRYSAAPGFTGVVTFTYTADDGTVPSNPAVVVLTVTNPRYHFRLWPILKGVPLLAPPPAELPAYPSCAIGCGENCCAEATFYPRRQLLPHRHAA